jgi:GNAT superfamily N-acetyltransferase
MSSPASPTIVRGELAFRPATLEDAAFAADVLTACFPEDPMDPHLLRHYIATAHRTYVKERFVVRYRDTQAGAAWHEHPPWDKVPKRHGRVRAELLPSLRSRARLAATYDFIEERSRQSGTEVFDSHAREDDPETIGLLTARGYRQDRLQKFWELDLLEQRERVLALADASRARMRELGVRILTLDQDRDPDRYRHLHALSAEAEEDIPAATPQPSTPFDEFVERLSSPVLQEDRIWIARLGADLAGVSMLAFPPERGVVFTDWTATARSARGRGIARALKLETLVQAIGLGIPRVRADNDFENAPILHLNEALGYRRIPGWLSFLKPA